MKKRLAKKIEKMRRKKIHEALEMVLEINTTQVRSQELYTRRGRTLKCSSLPRPRWRYGATAERACEQEKGVTGCWKDVTAAVFTGE